MTRDAAPGPVGHGGRAVRDGLVARQRPGPRLDGGRRRSPPDGPRHRPRRRGRPRDAGPRTARRIGGRDRPDAGDAGRRRAAWPPNAASPTSRGRRHGRTRSRSATRRSTSRSAASRSTTGRTRRNPFARSPGSSGPARASILVDLVAPEDAGLDTFLNTLELLRDPTHGRTPRASDWRAVVVAAGLTGDIVREWSFRHETEDWLARTAPARGAPTPFAGCCARRRSPPSRRSRSRPTGPASRSGRSSWQPAAASPGPDPFGAPRWPVGTSPRRPAPSRAPRTSRRPSRGRRAAPSACGRGRANSGDRPLAGEAQGLRRRVVEQEAGPVPGILVDVDDRVGQAARPARHGRRAVAHRDHLALAARLEPRRHQEEVGACVDPPGQVAVEALDDRDPARVGPPRPPASPRRARRRRCRGRRSARRARRAPARLRRRGRSPSGDRGGRSRRGSAPGPPDRSRRARRGRARQAAFPARSARVVRRGDRRVGRRVPERPGRGR